MAISALHSRAPVVMYDGKVSTDDWYPVLLVDVTDGQTGETGIAFGSVDADYSIVDATGTLTSYTVTTNDWKEIGEGLYAIRIGAAEWTAAGIYVVRIGDTSPAGQKYTFAVRVRAVTLDDLVRSASPTRTLAVDVNGRVDVGAWLGTAVTTSATTLKPQVDVFSISDDATAANNAELMFDGTGYAGGTAKLDVNVVQISSDSGAADNLEAAYDGAGYAGGTIKQDVNVVAISGDTAAADNLEAYSDGTTPQPVNVIQISADANAADNLELAYDGTGYAGGTIKPGVDVVKISGDSVAADNLELYCDGTTRMPVNIMEVYSDRNAPIALRNAFNGAGYAFTNCVMPQVSAITSEVDINLSQDYTEGQNPRTIGGALEATEAEYRNKIIDLGPGSTRTSYQSDNSTPVASRSRTSETTIQP